MMSAAVRSSFFVLRIRPSGASSVSVGSPSTSGMTATPVSNPDRPSASFGNRMIAIAPIISGSPCCSKSDAFHDRDVLGMAEDLLQPVDDDDAVERHVDADEADREHDRFAEALEEDARRAPAAARA